jgi:hypothetical protein
MFKPMVVLLLSFLNGSTINGVTNMAQTASAERKVASNVVTSERDPAVRIELPKAAHYLGADRWVLYSIADCELHAWVEAAEADAQRHVGRLYWVQFEGYLPSRPDLHHAYDSPKHATIGGMDFYVDSWVRTKDAITDSGSDREHIEALVRVNHLLDKEKRKELMIIYGEDLAPTGFSAAELSEGGKAHDRWPGIADGLLERAERDIRIEFAKP